MKRITIFLIILVMTLLSSGCVTQYYDTKFEIVSAVNKYDSVYTIGFNYWINSKQEDKKDEGNVVAYYSFMGVRKYTNKMKLKKYGYQEITIDVSNYQPQDVIVGIGLDESLSDYSFKCEKSLMNLLRIQH